MKVTEIETLEVVKLAGSKSMGYVPGMNLLVKAGPKVDIKQIQGGYLVKYAGADTSTFIPMTNIKRAYVVEDEAQQQGKGKAA